MNRTPHSKLVDFSYLPSLAGMIVGVLVLVKWVRDLPVLIAYVRISCP